MEAIPYGQLHYWEERYAKERKSFDWFQPYPGPLRDVVSKALGDKPKSEVKVLVPGCGTSKMSQDMSEDGFASVISIDWSENCISIMKELQDSSSCSKDFKTKCTFEKMDVRHLEFADNSFDLIIVKGLMDAMLCAENGTLHLMNAMAEMSRVLNNKSGVMVVVSYGEPDKRLYYIEKDEFSWQVQVVKVPRPQLHISKGISSSKKDESVSQPGGEHFVYVCTKTSTTNAATQEKTSISSPE